MEKLKMHSPNFAEENIAQLATLFPGCVTESADDNGKLKKAIDFDLLRQELSTEIVEGPRERYHLNWPGKREALLTANAPIAKMLRPCREESVDFDTTENLFIEGDNLDALKLMQETYLGKIKMIYIDPPYNTGRDFIYTDNFAESTEEYLLDSGQKDDEGNRLVANTDSNGRFHSDWLSMMYSRLKLARNLLKDDGVIFISIDDGEVHNLRTLCNEVFGESNLVGTFVWMSKKGGGSDNSRVVTDQEYVLCYVREASSESFLTRIEIPAEPLDSSDEYGSYRIGRELNKWGANSRREDRPTMYFPIPGPNGEDVFPIRNDGSEGCWRWGKKNMLDAISKHNVEFVHRENGTYIAYEKIRNQDSRLKPHRTFLTDCGATADGSKLIKNLFDDVKVFDFPKPLDLIESLVRIGSTGKNDMILDFFPGSATTAHAVMQLNSEDSGKRKFIMVQLPEACDQKSEAFKAGYKTIAEISKERIRRAGKKIKAELRTKKEKEQPSLLEVASPIPHPSSLDIGFRVLKVDSSNMANVYYTPDAIDQDQLNLQTENIKDDRTSEDLLFQVLLDWGVDLTLSITKETIGGREVFFVDGNALAACFEKKGQITEEFCKDLAKRQPLRVVFRDSGFNNDSVKINVEQIFKLMSSHTEVKTI